MLYPTKQLGDFGQNIVEKYLRKNNYFIIEKNWYCHYGEIDIIALDLLTKELVFVEVKTRTNTSFGNPEEAVTKKKQLKLAKTLELYLEKCWIKNSAFRFDIVCLTFKNQGVWVKHLKDIALMGE